MVYHFLYGEFDRNNTIFYLAVEFRKITALTIRFAPIQFHTLQITENGVAICIRLQAHAFLFKKTYRENIGEASLKRFFSMIFWIFGNFSLLRTLDTRESHCVQLVLR